ncbi:hypothetical protein BGY98DRAFT_1167764 [Russula aff. rugulosa BPL654]|nr:hypothetical protein BGY98DRAFT_1167764 [Russula aff. rugulosa BPL654]
MGKIPTKTHQCEAGASSGGMADRPLRTTCIPRPVQETKYKMKKGLDKGVNMRRVDIDARLEKGKEGGRLDLAEFLSWTGRHLPSLNIPTATPSPRLPCPYVQTSQSIPTFTTTYGYGSSKQYGRWRALAHAPFLPHLACVLPHSSHPWRLFLICLISSLFWDLLSFGICCGVLVSASHSHQDQRRLHEADNCMHGRPRNDQGNLVVTKGDQYDVRKEALITMTADLQPRSPTRTSSSFSPDSPPHTTVMAKVTGAVRNLILPTLATV